MTGNDLRSATLILRVLTREGDDAALAAIAEELTLADAYRDAQCIGYVQGRGGRVGDNASATTRASVRTTSTAAPSRPRSSSGGRRRTEGDRCED